jgi:hypothetical protein
MHHKFLAAARVAAAVVATALVGAAGAVGDTSHSGRIAYQSVATTAGKPTDVVTGALIDHGTDKGVGRNAQKIILSKGTFTVNTTRFNKSIKFKLDKKDCTAVGHGFAADLPITKGTGAYAAITGKITVHASFNFIDVVKHGKCDFSKASAGTESFIGTGHVSY